MIQTGRFLRVVAAAIIITGAFATVQPSRAAVGEERLDELVDRKQGFDAAIGDAKKSMMGAPQQAVENAQKAEMLANAFADPDQKRISIATSLWLQGEASTRLNKPAEALPLLERAEAYLDDNSSQLAGDLLLSKGRTLRVLGRDGEALENFQTAYKIFEIVDASRSQAIALQSIGTLYDHARQYERVIEYYAKASEVFSDDAMLDLVSFNNRSNAYRELGDYEAAHALADRALAMAVKSGSNLLQARILTNIAVLEIRQGNLDAAETTIAEGFDKAASDDAKGWAPFLWGARAKLEFTRNDLEAAEQAAQKTFAGLDLAQTTAPFRDFHETAYAIYNQLGRHELALGHIAAFKRLDDQGRDVAASANLAILNAEFEFANKELEISKLRTGQLERDIAIGNQRQRLQTYVLQMTAMIGFSVIAFFFWSNLTARKNQKITEAFNRELESKNDELATTNVELENANQAKTEFLATTSHEIRTPLNAIIGLSDVILNGDAIIDRDREYLAMVNESGKHLLDIVNDILDVSKLEAGKITIHKIPFDIAGCVRNVAEIWRKTAEEKGLDVAIEVAPSVGSYISDARLIRQIVSNLISNAVKFTTKGEVKISLESVDRDGFTIVISDTGIGIENELQEKIFEPFCQADSSLRRKYEGTGLGLAICKMIIAELDGDIALESAPGKGSTFMVTIPAERAHASNEQGGDEQPLSPCAEHRENLDGSRLEDIRVLVAEDNVGNAMVIRALLEDRVGHIEVVENGADALETLQKQEIDVILMDKQMPVMDGIAATKAIRSLPPPVGDLPIIAVTADAFANDREALLQIGMDDYVSKPLDAETLCNAISRCLNAKKAAAA